MKTSQFRKVAVEAAVKAGTFVRKNVGRVKKVHYKGEINVVTDIDKKAEALIVSTIRRHYPEHDFLAEEGTYPEKYSDYTWVIDPLDGTTNFLHSFPFYCVSVALAYKGRILAGAVYDPTREELFFAEKGKGAFLNKKRIHVSKIRNMKKALLATGFAYDIREAANNNIDNFEKFLKSAQAVRRAGSAAIDMCYVACGRFDGFWEMGLHPWDTAAALLITEEAGGKVTRMDGTKYNIHDTDTLASNLKIHAQMVRILSG